MKASSSVLTRTQPNEYKHIVQKFSFRTKAQPLASGAVMQLFQPANESMDVGGLFDYIMSLLHSVAGATTSPVPFSLVNVLSPATRTSTGCNTFPPPSEAMPAANANLVFTFALTPIYDWTVPAHLMETGIRSTYVNVWNVDASPRPQFINIAISSVKCKALGLDSLTWTRLRYLYFVVGMMTKNAVRLMRARSNPSIPFTVPDNPWSTYESIGYLDITSLALRIPYSKWQFSQDFLQRAPNLLSPRQISPELIQFCIASDIMDKVRWPERLTPQVYSILFGSVVSFVQQVESLGDTQLETQELLVALAVCRYREEQVQIASDPGRLLPVYARQLFEALHDYSEQVSEILAPYMNSARNLLAGNYGEIGQLSNLYDIALSRRNT